MYVGSCGSGPLQPPNDVKQPDAAAAAPCLNVFLLSSSLFLRTDERLKLVRLANRIENSNS